MPVKKRISARKVARRKATKKITPRTKRMPHAKRKRGWSKSSVINTGGLPK